MHFWTYLNSFKCILYSCPTLCCCTDYFCILNSTILRSSSKEGLCALSRCVVQWLALTKPPSFTQTNRTVHAEEQSRNKSLSRLSMKASSLHYLYRSRLGLKIVWRAVCFSPNNGVSDYKTHPRCLIMQHGDNEPALGRVQCVDMLTYTKLQQHTSRKQDAASEVPLSSHSPMQSFSIQWR